MQRAFLLAAMFIFILSGCGVSYRVAIPSRFENLHPRTNKINYIDTVLRQIYYPLLVQDAGGDIGSYFLDMTRSRQLNRDATSFLFCLKQGVLFWDGTSVDPKHLLENLTEILLVRNIEANLAASKEKDCVSANLRKGRPQLFSELTGVDSTILKQRDQQNFDLNRHLPVGVGPFRPKEISNDRLKLSRTPTADGDIDELIFETVTPSDNAETKRILQRSYDEWNFYNGVVDIQSDAGPRTLEVRPSVKTMVVWISIKDDCTRSAVWTNLRSRFSDLRGLPVATETIKIPGILPIGVLGFEEKVPDEASLPERCDQGAITEPVPLFSVYNQMHDGLKGLLAHTQTEDNGSKIEFVNLDDDSVMKLMASGKDFVGVISTSSTRSRVSDLLEFLVNVSPGKRIDGLAKLLQAMDEESDPQLKAIKAAQAHRLALDSDYILPIGQFNTTLSFPNFVTNVAFRDQFQTSPDYSGYKVSYLAYWWDKLSRGDM